MPETTTDVPGRDLLGRDLDDVEREIADLYVRAKALLARDDLPPCASANVRAVTAALGLLVSDLAIDWEDLSDLGV